MIKLATLFYIFFKIGAFSFGGGLAMLPLIFQNVAKFDLMSPGDFANLVALSQVTPGPIMINAATYVGYNYAGILGAIAATMGAAIPSFVVMILAIKFLDKAGEKQLVQNIMKGIKPVTVGLIGAGAVFLAKAVPVSYITVAIFCATVILSGKFKVSTIKIIVVMAIAGGLLCG